MSVSSSIGCMQPNSVRPPAYTVVWAHPASVPLSVPGRPVAMTADALLGLPEATRFAFASVGALGPVIVRETSLVPPGPMSLAVIVAVPVTRNRIARSTASPTYGPLLPIRHSMRVTTPLSATERTTGRPDSTFPTASIALVTGGGGGGGGGSGTGVGVGSPGAGGGGGSAPKRACRISSRPSCLSHSTAVCPLGPTSTATPLS